jgi:hypothetical protein
MRCHHSLDIRRNPRTTKLHWAGRRELRRVYRRRRPPRLHRSGSPSAECHGTLQFTRTLRRTTGETPDPKGPQHIREHCRRVAKLPHHRATAAPRTRADQRLTKFITESRAQTSSLSLTITTSPSSHFVCTYPFFSSLLFPNLLHPTPASILHVASSSSSREEKLDTRNTLALDGKRALVIFFFPSARAHKMETQFTSKKASRKSHGIGWHGCVTPHLQGICATTALFQEMKCMETSSIKVETRLALLACTEGRESFRTRKAGEDYTHM